MSKLNYFSVIYMKEEVYTATTQKFYFLSFVSDSISAEITTQHTTEGITYNTSKAKNSD